MDYHIGDIVEGVITGIQPYGAFVQIDKNHNGLLHISEISDDYIKDINEYVKMQETIKVKILDISDDDHHYKLSLKAISFNKRNRRKNYNQYHAIPKSEIGFKTIEDNLQGWINKFMEDEK